MGADMMKLAAMAFIGLCAVLALRSHRSELAMIVSMAAGIAVMGYGVDTIGGIAEKVNTIIAQCGLDADTIKTAGKMVGIAYIAQFSADTCRDCGESSLAGKVELTGRTMMVAAAIPLVISTVESIGGLMEG